MEQYQWLLTLPALQVISLLGMLMNFFTKKIKGETLTDIASYFSDHFKSTVVAVVASCISCLGYYIMMATGQVADIVTVFGLGFMSDAFFNKWDQSKTPQ
jgi:hypothetical protein